MATYKAGDKVTIKGEGYVVIHAIAKENRDTLFVKKENGLKQWQVVAFHNGNFSKFLPLPNDMYLPVEVKKEPAKITKTTLVSFVKKNHGGLFVREDSRFDGNTDGIEQNKNAQFTPVIHAPAGADLKTVRRSYILGDALDLNFISGGSSTQAWEDDEFTGYSHSNCCGRWILAVRKDGAKHDKALKLDRYHAKNACYAVEYFNNAVEWAAMDWQTQKSWENDLQFGVHNFMLNREVYDWGIKYTFTDFGLSEFERAVKEIDKEYSDWQAGEPARLAKEAKAVEADRSFKESVDAIEFTAVDYEGTKAQLKSVKVSIPSVNKNNSIDSNDRRIKESSDVVEMRIVRTVAIAAKDWLLVCENLLYNMVLLWANVGTTRVDDDSLFENVGEWTEAYNAIFRLHGYQTVCEVINAETNETFYVDTQGYDYARYVGRAASGDYFAPLTTTKRTTVFMQDDTAEVIACQLFDTEMTQDDAQSYTAREFNAIYEKLEDMNRHDDCAIFHAKRYGMPIEVMMLIDIKARSEERGEICDTDYKLRYALGQAIKARLQ